MHLNFLRAAVDLREREWDVAGGQVRSAGRSPAVAQNLKRCWQNRVAITRHGHRRHFLRWVAGQNVSEARNTTLKEASTNALYPHIFACLEGAVAIGEGFMSDSVCEMTTDTHIAMQSCHFSFFAPSGVVAGRIKVIAYYIH